MSLVADFRNLFLDEIREYICRLRQEICIAFAYSLLQLRIVFISVSQSREFGNLEAKGIAHVGEFQSALVGHSLSHIHILLVNTGDVLVGKASHEVETFLQVAVVEYAA